MPKRILSIDAFRGLVMALMLAEVMRLPSLPKAFPESWLAAVLAFNQSHVAWAWGSLHDMIQPGFSFLVGAALPFSILARQAKGQSFRLMCAHAIWRSFLLIALGIAFAAIFGKVQPIVFGETTAKPLPHPPALLPVFAHLLLVLILGLYMPPYLADWYRQAAALLG